jgi:hypothetical protein
MQMKRLILFAGGAIMLLVATFIVIRKVNGGPVANREGVDYSQTPKKERVNQDGMGTRLRVERQSSKTDEALVLTTVDDFCDELDRLETELRDHELDQKKLELIQAAVGQLRGQELIELYQYLFDKAQNRYLDWAINRSFVYLVSAGDYEKGLDLIAKLENNLIQTKLAGSVGRLVRPNDLERFWASLNTNSAKDMLLYSFGLQNINIDPPKTLEILFDLSSEQFRPEYVYSLASQIRDGADFKSLLGLVSQHQESPHSETVRKGIFESWVRAKPLAASGYLNSLADQAPPNGTRTVAEVWMKIDPTSATAWIQGMVPGKQRDIGLTVLARNQLQANPNAAFATSLQISDPGFRNEAVAGIMSQWFHDDPETAKRTYEKATGEEYQPPGDKPKEDG